MVYSGLVIVVGLDKLDTFAKKYAPSRATLARWLTLTREANWKNLVEVQKTFRDVDEGGGQVVFNVGGNKYRLIATVTYPVALVQITWVLTHADYDRRRWKK